MPQIEIPDFIEKEFPNKINFGFSGGPEFFTQISTTTGGHEQRVVNWEKAKHRFSASHEVKDMAELKELLDFFFSVRGMASGFRFVDWHDWSSDVDANKGIVYPTLAAVGDMTHQAMLNIDSGAIGIGDGAAVNFQAQKLYSSEAVVGDLDSVQTIVFDKAAGEIIRTVGTWLAGDGFGVGQFVYASGTPGNLNDGSLGKITDIHFLDLRMFVDGIKVDDSTPEANIRLFSQGEDVPLYIREIKKLVTIRVLVEDVVFTEAPSGIDTYTVDMDTGIVTFNTAPASGEFVEADFIFNVPVRFDSDSWVQQLNHFNVGDVLNIELLELRL